MKHKLALLNWVLAGSVSIFVLWAISDNVLPFLNADVLENFSLVIQFIAVFLGWIFFSSLRFKYCVQHVVSSDFSVWEITQIYTRSFWGMYLLPSSIGIDFIKLYLFKVESDFEALDVVKCTIIEKASGLLVIVANTFTLVLLILIRDLSSSEVVPFFMQLSTEPVKISELILILIFKLVFTTLITVVFLLFINLKSQRDRKSVCLFGARLGLMSFIIHLLGMSFYYVIGLNVGLAIGLGFYVLLVPYIYIVSVLPLTIGGWGLREAFTVFLLSASNEQVQGELTGIFAALTGCLALISLLIFFSFKIFQIKSSRQS